MADSGRSRGSRRVSRSVGAATGVLALVGLATAPAFASPGVTAMWHLDESAGSTTMVDSSGGGHDGTISSGVRVGLPGVLGSAYGFSGSGSIVRVPDPTGALNPGRAPLTISAYLQVPADLKSGDYNVLEKGQATATGGAYKLEIAGKSSSSKFGYPDCAFNYPGGKQRVYGPKAINDGKWHLVECHLTTDTVYASVDSVRGPALKRTVTSIANTVDLTIGGKPNNSHYFRGLADEITIQIG
ncbi:LamG-like jellyroll fold domain-containing protein [Pedococcus sp. 2YAF34]|uniref:LamG-like jellyroll fold domain-containing protein n=1 Tax=Pedococcus sp. 2YAF34 TaxID=3233032 RepID=UPI003F9580A9